MRWGVVAFSSAMVFTLAAGCQESRLRDRTVMQAVTVNDLYYYQVLNNLAMIRADAGAMPYFSQPNTGTNQSARSLMANYTPGWDFISAKGAFIGRWLFDKNSSVFGGTVQNTETWQTTPTTNPDKIYLLKLAYDQTLGLDVGAKQKTLIDFMAQYSSLFKDDYFNALRPGWYCTGRKKDVPRGAAYVGHYGTTYAWVMPAQTRNLSAFTLAVLNIVTASAKQGTTPSNQAAKEAADKVDAVVKAKAADQNVDTRETYEKALAPYYGALPTNVTEKLRAAIKAHLGDGKADEQALSSEVDRITDEVQAQTPTSVLAPRDLPIIPASPPPTPPPIP